MKTVIWLWVYRESFLRHGDATYASANARSAVKAWETRMDPKAATEASLTELAANLSRKVAAP